jgi:predicted nucleotidyltransferase
MLHKRNDLEIIEVIRKQSNHIRKISQNLNMIPSTVMRIMKRLEKERVVDYERQGKNKKYFLKDTPEAQSYLYLTEEYKLIKLLQKPQLRRVIKELKQETNNELIILFGSHVKSSANKNSDIDLYIESTSKKLKNKLMHISEKLQIKLGKFNKHSLLSKEIIKDHVLIQNKERFYALIKNEEDQPYPKVN